MNRVDYMAYAMKFASLYHQGKMDIMKYQFLITKLDEWVIKSQEMERVGHEAKV